MNFLFVTFFMPECAHLNPGFFIIHLDESKETTEGLPKIDKGSAILNKQTVELNKG